MKVLAFDIWGDFGHFKKFYTTASPLTFSIPPPTALYGLLGAILGIDKEKYLNHINGKTTRIAIQILNPIKKIRFSLNLIDTKNSGSFHLIKVRTQIKTEFLKNPKYRIFINLKDENLFSKLIKQIKIKETYYTPSLGLANLIANFEYAGEYDTSPLKTATSVDTVILAENIEEIEIETEKKFFKEKLPMDMSAEREVLEYKDVVMEVSGKNIRGKFKNCFKAGEFTISFL